MQFLEVPYSNGPLTTFEKGVGVVRSLKVNLAREPGTFVHPITGNPVKQVSVTGGRFISNGTVWLAGLPINMKQLASNGIDSVDGVVMKKQSVDFYKGPDFLPANISAATNLFVGKTITESANPINIKGMLGIGNAPTIGLDLTGIRAKAQNISTVMGGSNWANLNGEDMNTLYSTYAYPKYVDESGDEWMVLNYDICQGGRPFDKGGDGFTGRVIWLVEGSVNVQANEEFYEHASTGLTFIYVGGSAKLTGIGGCQSFKGMIYSETSETNIYKALNDCEFKGAIYQKDGSGQLRIEGPPSGSAGYFEVCYDQPIVEEIASRGIFFDPTNTNTEILAINPGGSISTNLVSQSM